MSFLRRSGLFALACLAILACHDSTAPSPPPIAARIGVTPASAVVQVDSTVTLTAQVWDQAGRLLTVSRIAWAVFDTTVAQVTSDGHLTGRVLGPTTLIVATDSLSLQVPIAVVTRFTQVTMGYRSACALSPDGHPYCWGLQLGVPLRAPGLPRMTAVGAGDQNACGLAVGGAAYCWAIDTGATPGTDIPISLPTAVGGPSFASLSVGYDFACGLTGTGAAYCWGGGPYGATGTDTGAVNTPQALSGGLVFTALSSNDHSCALTASGAAYCWGYNYTGELGAHALGTCNRPCSVTPVQVDSVPSLTGIAAGGSHSCGIAAGGAGYCWGDNSSGQLGDTLRGSGCFFRQYVDSTYPCSEVPMAVRTPLLFVSLAAGDAHTCGIATTGALYCWGDNSGGQFGDGTLTSSAVPVLAAGGLHLRTVTASRAATCGVATDGVAYCWGDDWFNTLGDGPARYDSRNTPTRVVFQP